MSHTITVPSYRGGDPGPRPRTGRRRTAGLAAALTAGLMLAAAPTAHADTLTKVIRVGGGPSEVAITPNGKRAYVTNSGSDTVSVINTFTQRVTDTIEVGDRPTGVAITPDGTRAYVTNSNVDTVSVISTATNTVTTTIKVGDGANAVAITGNGTRAYVTNLTDDTVSVIDIPTNTVTTTIKVDDQPREVAITPDSNRAYVIHPNEDDGSIPPNADDSGRVSVIDTATNSVTNTIEVDGDPYGVAITPDGTHAYITTVNGVSVIDTRTNTVTDTVWVGFDGDVAITPDGTQAYVTQGWGINTVSVIDTSTNTVTDTVAVGPWFEAVSVRGTSGVAITPDGTRAYVTHEEQVWVSVIAIGDSLLAGSLGSSGSAAWPS
ncbi:YncE family protein [Rhodococcus sp. NPDC049939]|uniref:YncE family protein n=1 Tax=Rhodococcus sp. NPDC049939 TaxID=3155511 RepID=UPI0033E595D5